MSKIGQDNYPLREASFDRAPYQPHSETSRAAARSVIHRLGPLELEVLNAIAECQLAGGTGLTDSDLIEAFGTQSVRPRRIYLTQLGKLRDTGTTRKTRSGRAAVVWALA